jgi:opacity protein-like surface antigen
MTDTTRRTFFAALALAVGLALHPAAAPGQLAGEPRGLLLGAHLAPTTVEFESATGPESALGLGLTLGYAFTPRWALLLTADGASYEPDGARSDYTVGHGDLLLRFSFAGIGGALVPLLEAGIGGRQVETRTEVGTFEAGGGTGTLGAGLQYFLSPPLALELGVRGTFGQLEEITWGTHRQEIDEPVTSLRWRAGIVWYPQIGR